MCAISTANESRCSVQKSCRLQVCTNAAEGPSTSQVTPLTTSQPLWTLLTCTRSYTPVDHHTPASRRRYCKPHATLPAKRILASLMHKRSCAGRHTRNLGSLGLVAASAMTSRTRSIRRLLRELAVQDCRKPRWTAGRVPSHQDPRLGGWTNCHACTPPTALLSAQPPHPPKNKQALKPCIESCQA